MLPYFLEQQVLENLPGFTMLDYQVDYANHKNYTSGKALNYEITSEWSWIIVISLCWNGFKLEALFTYISVWQNEKDDLHKATFIFFFCYSVFTFFCNWVDVYIFVFQARRKQWNLVPQCEYLPIDTRNSSGYQPKKGINTVTRATDGSTQPTSTASSVRDAWARYEGTVANQFSYLNLFHHILWRAHAFHISCSNN